MSGDLKFYAIAYALVFAIGWFLPMSDRLPYAMGVLAVTVVLLVDYARPPSPAGHVHEPVFPVYPPGHEATNAYCLTCGFFPLPLEGARPIAPER